MKTVSKINPEEEYSNANNIITAYFKKGELESEEAQSLKGSIDNIMTATRVLMDREERRRGLKNPPPTDKPTKPKGRQKGQKREDAKKLPSERYPDVDVVENIIKEKEPPKCPCCNKLMHESGMFDITEKLETIPKKYYIIRNKRVKYNCSSCHGSMINTSSNERRIVPTSNYGDSLIIDVALSKYCDLIPIERYVEMAARNGLEGLPPQSLIGLTHHLANFLLPVYSKIKEEIISATILLSDETTHRMLEGDATKQWYLWGFFTQTASFFEVHDTRSGQVVFDLLRDSRTEYLLSDGYSAYNKAIEDIKKEEGRTIIAANCNAHAVRYFKEASLTWEKESAPFLKLYEDIYKLEKQRKEEDITEEEQLKIREKMLPLFEKIKKGCEESLSEVMPGSGIAKALNYYLNQYNELILCTKNIEIPLDNNLAERELRPSVIGRKTWYGTHSKRGALTNAILFTIIQSCKMNKINPRSYFPWVVKRILQEEGPVTPYEYLKLSETQ